MDDRALVAAMVAGDPRGLDGAYRRYAPRLYAYCRATLRDADAAADAVQDTFVIAGRRAGQLREPERLLPWLYAIARHECLRQIRDRRREAPAELEDASADTADLGAGVRAAEVRELVHAAAAGLGDGDREVIELALRHGLSAVDVGAVLGVSANHAHARLSRARSQLERALGVLLVARAAACPALRELHPGWDGRLTPLLRKRLGRHVDGCARCRASRGTLLSPAALLTGYVAVPFTVLPAASWRPAGPPDVKLGRDGFPSSRRPSTWAAAGAAAVVAVLVVVVLTRPGEPVPPPELASGSASPVPSAAPGPPTPPVAPSASSAPPTPRATRSPVPVASEPTGPTIVAPTPSTKDPDPEPEVEAAFSVAASGGVRCGSDRVTYTLSADATASHTMTASRLVWRSAQSGTESAAMTVTTGSAARGSRTGLRYGQITWWVLGRAADGTTAESARETVTNPCRRDRPGDFTAPSASASPGPRGRRPGRPGAPTGPGTAGRCCRSRPCAVSARRRAGPGRASGAAAG
ncbi:sigma-70 family RNA polymerase sigma factor [Phytohabitans flavus]|uniref:sigma-70 family RNA polymerase sigma factor n=1 Tax=Phytohabitans flavus TaxID=1076124 RepID=UPI0015657391|nr:sigma-70 family RNA polymerase sigma factor [Phytohabitans flavus]